MYIDSLCVSYCSGFWTMFIKAGSFKITQQKVTSCQSRRARLDVRNTFFLKLADMVEMCEPVGCCSYRT